MIYIFLAIGLVVGTALGYFIAKSQQTTSTGSSNSKEVDELRQKAVRLEERDKQLEEIKVENERLRTEKTELTASLESSRTHFKNQEERIKEQKEDLENLNERFQKEFENIASKVLRQNSDEISKISKERLETTLKPLGEKIKSFEEKIEQSGKEREGLKEQILLLHDLNKQMAEEAHNLTKTLKGDVKKQGNWGEFVLEKILESSGLEAGREYETQYSASTEDGSRLQPDVIVHLPDDKHIIVDSKVSLIAYDAFTNTDDDDQKMSFLKEHINSVKTHIKDLSEKNYQLIYGINSPDFVLMFMPMEAAFAMTIHHEPDLYNYAWDRKIVLVSPTTLLATLRTVSSIWKQEKQNQNAIEIARQSGNLYDKFVGFIEDMQNIERYLTQTQKSYDSAMNKLSTGSGNLVKRAEDIKKLGVKTSKQIDKTITDKSEDGV